VRCRLCLRTGVGHVPELNNKPGHDGVGESIISAPGITRSCQRVPSGVGYTPLPTPQDGMSFSRCLLAVGINCCTMLLALFVAFLACVGVGFARGDAAFNSAPTSLTTHETLWIFAQVTGIAALTVAPSVCLLLFKKTDAGLIAACAPLVIAVLIISSLGKAFL